MTAVVRRPGPPLAGLVTEIVYRTGGQSRTSAEKILPGPGTALWVNLNRDAFRAFGWAGQVRQVPGAMVSMLAARHGYCDQAHLADEFRVNGPNHVRCDVRS